MKLILRRPLFAMLMCLPFTACTAPRLASGPAGSLEEDGDTFTGVVIASSPERVTIQLTGEPRLLVIEGDGTAETGGRPERMVRSRSVVSAAEVAAR